MDESPRRSTPAAAVRGCAALLWLGLAFAAGGVFFDFLWHAHRPGGDGVVFAIRRLGLAVKLSEAQYEAFATAAAGAALACVVVAFVLARRALRRAEAGGEEGTAPAPVRPLSSVLCRLLAALAAVVACAVPMHMLVGWADGRVNLYEFYDAAWYRRSFFRELGLVSSARLFWLAAVVALGGWLVLRPGGRWGGLMSRALGAASRVPRGLVVGVACAVVVGLALALSLGMLRGEPHHPDANWYYYQAKTFLAGRLWSPLLGAREFFDPRLCPRPQSLGIVFVGQRWFYCGLPFGPLLYTLGLAVGVPWLVSPLLGGATVFLTYLMAKEWFGPAAGLVALPLCALSGWLVFNSVEYLTHLPCLVPMLVFMLAVRRVVRGGSWRWAAVGGLMLGLAVNARPVTAAALCVPFAVLWLVWLARSPRAAWRPTLAFAAALALPMAGLLAYNWATTGHPLTFGYHLCWGEKLPDPGDTGRVAGWRWRPAVGVTNFLAALYHFSAASYHWPIPAAGAILAAAALLGAWRGADGERWPLLLVLAALVLVLAHVRCAFISMGMGGPRYVFEALPLAIVLAAGALVALQGRLVRAGASPQRARAVLGLLLAACFAYGTVSTVVREVPQFRNLFEVDLRMFDTVKRQAERPALVFVPVPPNWRFTYKFSAALSRNDPALSGPILYARDLEDRNPLLIRALPGRHLYRWDYESFSLVRLAPDGVTEAPRAASGAGR